MSITSQTLKENVSKEIKYRAFHGTTWFALGNKMWSYKPWDACMMEPFKCEASDQAL